MAQPFRKRFKQWQKRMLKSSRTLHVVLSHMAACFMRGIYYTCRHTRRIPDTLLPYYRGEKRAIFVFWHGRMIMMPFLKPPGNMAVLISHHNDGSLITTTMERFGIGAVRGSKSQGSSEAVRGLVEAAQQGKNIAITPDGPRGPFQVPAPGAIYVAMRSGLPIIPIAYSASRHWRLRSWDKFMIAKPFSRIAFLVGDPIQVAPQLNAEALAAAVADMKVRLDRLTAEADTLCGVAP